MASQHAFISSSQNKGTLIPGQFISVNKFNVQVERYLSQGGFAHVYLVRTAKPVYNTTHHVLKRIAVANEVMLTEVKKEVDIMRLLRGHPNIVHLIDAAWHKMSNGIYEVFILMEFCPGGGIIDMMNRRLRERLTEAEILQIFVDVCEGVAYMHNLQPALLHRDLKVENILQSTPTSFKLCDFGSATAVSRPPANTQEIRALEADLNRHTTLQYRAPEMIDLYSRKPVDEKSDIWALGVLLYKLCYYTTPFEEHGQLAILNVQYRTPPYPVYSPQMNQLIGSMLQEHGIHRPSIFDLLTLVHSLRGTKSRFQYNVPVPHPLSPRHQTSLKPSISPNTVDKNASSPNIPSMSPSPSKGQGIQAREQVMEAIAPLLKERMNLSGVSASTPGYASTSENPDIHIVSSMRRGRPPTSKEPEPTSQKPHDGLMEGISTEDWLEEGLTVGDDKVWKDSTVHNTTQTSGSSVDVWSTDRKGMDDSKGNKHQGFGDDFGETLWESFGSAIPQTAPTNDILVKPIATPKRPLLSGNANIQSRPSRRDAFEGLGLGLSTDKPAPTLGEARKLRTGLAVVNAVSTLSKYSPNGSTLRLTPSPGQLNVPQSVPQSYISPNSTSSSRIAPQPALGPKSHARHDGLAAESRFPSLEELDATFSPNIDFNQTNISQRLQDKPIQPIRRDTTTTHPSVATTSRSNPPLYGVHGTGAKSRATDTEIPSINRPQPPDDSDTMIRPGLTRRHRSSVSIKHPGASEESFMSPSSMTYKNPKAPSPRLPTEKSHDWLTGGDSHKTISTTSPTEMPVLRDSPSKRAPVIQRSTIPIQDAITAHHDHIPPPKPIPGLDNPSTPSKLPRTLPYVSDKQRDAAIEPGKFMVTRAPVKLKDPELSSSADEGPEDAGSSLRVPRKVTETPKKRTRKGRQSSVHDLVDLYGGGLMPKNKERETSSIGVAELTTQELNGRTPVPISTSNLPVMFSPPNPSNETLSPAQNVTPKKPIPSRTRPQSMLIFPSKSEIFSPSVPTPVSAGLAPPEDSRKRTNIRRTSISDIVQHYEGIGGSTKVATPKPISKIGSSSTDNGSYSKQRSNLEKDHIESSLNPPGDTNTIYTITGSKELDRKSPSASGTSIVSVAAPQYDTPHKRTDSVTPRGTRPEIPKTNIFPSRKVTDTPLSQPESRPSSPERPYQGVGKLIDQWQRKTAEAEAPKNVIGSKRGVIAAKPKGLVHSSSR